jgi:hypothetical protein
LVNVDANIIQEIQTKRMTSSDEEEKEEDWEKLVRRWEHVKVQGKLHGWTKRIIKPTSLEPTCRFIFFQIFMIITNIHMKAYGPDHILTALYFDLVERLSTDQPAPPVPETLAKKMPSIIPSPGSGLIGFSWTDEKNKSLNLSRGKNIMDFLESPSFRNVLNDLTRLEAEFTYRNC